MKLSLVVFTVLVAACVDGALWDRPDRPNCNEDPVKNNALCDIVPPGCRIPNCGTDPNYKKDMWFGNECYMNYYNKVCGTNYRKTIDAACNRLEKPPPSFEPCPWPHRPL